MIRSRRRLLADASHLVGLVLTPSAVVAACARATHPASGLLLVPSKAGTGRVVHNALSPHLEETPAAALDMDITPTGLHFVRDHFADATIDISIWRLRVGGAVRRRLEFGFADLLSFPVRTRTVLLECAGNSRSLFVPAASGTQWKNGAVSVAEWTGTSLKNILDEAGLGTDVVEIVFEGADSGRVARGLKRDKALDPDTLVAYRMNGEPLTAANGFPVRLIVPGYAGIASIKWLARIDAVTAPYLGWWNSQRYIYDVPGKAERTPVAELPVKSIITAPLAGTTVGGGDLVIRGAAWSGLAPIAKIEVSVNGGPWQHAPVTRDLGPLAWTRFELRASGVVPGKVTLRSRATDARGRVQPEAVEWNRFGYGYNAIQAVEVTRA